MSSGYLLIGPVIGGLLVIAGFLLAGGSGVDDIEKPEIEEVDGNSVCEERFGGNWTNQNMTRDFGNQSVGLSCTNGTDTRNISVAVDVEGL